MDTHLIPHDFPLGIVLEMPIPLEPPLDYLPEFLRERVVVKKMMHAQARAGGFGRVRGADTLLGRSDTVPM